MNLESWAARPEATATWAPREALCLASREAWAGLGRVCAFFFFELFDLYRFSETCAPRVYVIVGRNPCGSILSDTPASL